MKKILMWTLVMVAAGLLGWSQVGFTDPVTNIAQRIENQQIRINNGIAKGQLTRREADIVQDNLNWIKARFNGMKRDGILTSDEIRRLDTLLDQNNRMIAKEIRDFEPVYWGNFRQRIENQQKRIDDGIAKRQLTRHEAEVCQDNLNWIKDTFNRMRADGRLTAQEMNKLDEMLDRNNRLIARERNDYERFRYQRDYLDFFHLGVADPEANIAQRIENQQNRINNGIDRGQLTRREANIVQDNLNWIKARFASMKRDGILTSEEIRRLDALLDRNSRMIAKEIRDFEPLYLGNFRQRIENQQRRIDDGIAKRQLDRHEAEVCQDNLNWIKDTFNRMKADGRLTAQEMNKLDEMLDRNNRLIAKEIRDFEPLYLGNFRQRIENQQRRIDDGIAKRQLDRHEAEVCQDNLNLIKDTFNRMKADGRLTAREMNKLDEMLDRNDRLIAKESRDYNKFRDLKDIRDFFKF
jgi:uncharacterized tellurite resistance protein B-like protein